jgi:hypothetical protein
MRHGMFYLPRTSKLVRWFASVYCRLMLWYRGVSDVQSLLVGRVREAKHEFIGDHRPLFFRTANALAEPALRVVEMVRSTHLIPHRVVFDAGLLHTLLQTHPHWRPLPDSSQVSSVISTCSVLNLPAELSSRVLEGTYQMYLHERASRARLANFCGGPAPSL